MSWRPSASIKDLQHRSAIIWRIRSYFHQQGFDEVTTPTISQDTVVDRHIDPIELAGNQVHPDKSRLFLQTSPEFCMKRLLAAGMHAIYQICPAYRIDERGQFHNPEFTMLEWYRTGDNLDTGVQFLANLSKEIGEYPKVDICSYQDAFQEFAQLDPLSATLDDCRAMAQTLDVEPTWSCDIDDWLNLIFAEKVQPNLGLTIPTIITGYPASQSALARLSEHDTRIAERFELFIGGVELANGYHELLDPTELKERNTLVNRLRNQDGKSVLPQESRLLEAMHSGLPACSGCALGIERLLMVLMKKQAIDEVLAFPIERA